MKSLHFLKKVFAKLSGEKSTGPGEFNFFYISPLKSLDLVLIPGAKLDGHRDIWTECIFRPKVKRRERFSKVAHQFFPIFYRIVGI